MSPDIREVTATTVILPARCRAAGQVIKHGARVAA